VFLPYAFSETEVIVSAIRKVQAVNALRTRIGRYDILKRNDVLSGFIFQCHTGPVTKFPDYPVLLIAVAVYLKYRFTKNRHFLFLPLKHLLPLFIRTCIVTSPPRY